MCVCVCVCVWCVCVGESVYIFYVWKDVHVYKPICAFVFYNFLE